jgi:hypothetical protein
MPDLRLVQPIIDWFIEGLVFGDIYIDRQNVLRLTK